MLLPLIGTLEFSLRPKVFGVAWQEVIDDPKFLPGLGYSLVIALVTIAVSLLLLVPTAYWVRLKLPRLRPMVEFVTLLPFIVPPIVLVFGLLRTYSRPPVSVTSIPFGSDALLVGAYVVLSFPYMFRAIDAGLAAIDVRSLTEAAQSMGAGWGRILFRVIVPNLRTAILAGAFLTLAIVVGEYSIANYLAPWAFAPYLLNLGVFKAFPAAAGSVISFAVTWAAMGLLIFATRGASGRVQVTGAR
jgi:putative spermidine/putrescine transport system permease protein